MQLIMYIYINSFTLIIILMEKETVWKVLYDPQMQTLLSAEEYEKYLDRLARKVDQVKGLAEETEKRIKAITVDGAWLKSDFDRLRGSLSDTEVEVVGNFHLMGENSQVIIEPKETVSKLNSPWIPVSERLPDMSDNYLVYNGGTVSEAEWDLDQFRDTCWDTVHGSIKLRGVTHWMELPEPPKE